VLFRSLYLARLHEVGGDALGAKQALAVAQSLEPLPGETLHCLGNWRLKAGDADGAVTALARLVDLRPMRYSSMLTLGEALLQVGNVAAAEKAFTRASASPNPDFLVRVAARVFSRNYWQEAIEILHKALTLAPDKAVIWSQLARIHWEVYDLEQVAVCCQEVLRLDPQNRDARYMLNGLHGRSGDARRYLELAQSAYEQAGDPLSRLASTQAMASLYIDTMSPEAVVALHRRLVAPIEAAVALPWPAAGVKAQAAEGKRRLRIGYLSSDLFRQHPVNLFLLPVLLRHDRSRYDIHFYHTGEFVDEYTRQGKAAVEHWVEATAWDDNALREKIMADGIDILVDMAGHSSTHRLGVFVMRAAPVQATFLGYPHSTMLKSMDWFVGDRVVSPLEHAHLFSEGIAQLPGSVFCWAPVDDYPLPPPRPSDAPVVFGSFNNVMKYSPTTIALWARILQALPDARLLLKAPSFRGDSVRARFTALFAEHGIAADRLEFRGPIGLEEMMQEYGDIDIALDPLPYNGGTTTLQALWMGVPVVTLEGGNFVGRMGSSFLRTMGRSAWVAQDEDGYVAIAASLARQVRSLRGNRAAFRRLMAASPLCDIETYTRDLESLFLRMWKEYEAGSGARFLGAE
jgi:predicted O-linked N-acetylglucosamine transferase (SPINDLY family)